MYVAVRRYEEQAERMLIALEGQLQVYEVALGSGRELTLSVLDAGSPVGATGLVPRWVRNLHIAGASKSGGNPVGPTSGASGEDMGSVGRCHVFPVAASRSR